MQQKKDCEIRVFAVTIRYPLQIQLLYFSTTIVSTVQIF